MPRMGKIKLNLKVKESFKESLQNQCMQILIEGFREMKKQGSIDLSWEEERITMELRKFMVQCQLSKDWKIHVIPEPRIYHDEMYASSVAPKEAPKIDLQLLNWSSDHQLIFNIEAKNLAENDWTKSSGASVSSSFLRARYIDTGIQNFINGQYDFGCLTGYVLDGSTAAVVKQINALLQKRGRLTEILAVSTTPIAGHSDFCTSDHLSTKTGTPLHLSHIFLQYA